MIYIRWNGHNCYSFLFKKKQKKPTETVSSASFLDIYLKCDTNGQLSRDYVNQYDLSSAIATIPTLDCNITTPLTMILKNRFILDFKLFSEDINAFMKNLHAYFYFGSKLTVVAVYYLIFQWCSLTIREKRFYKTSI